MERIYKDKIKALWDNGESVERIIKQIPIEKNKVMREIIEMRKNGELLMADREKCNTKKSKVLMLYNSGEKNPYKIANEVGCAYTTVTSALAKAGIVRERPPHNYKERVKTDTTKLCENTQNIIEALKDGHPKSKIAKMYGVSRQWVFTVEQVYIKGIKRKV